MSNITTEFEKAGFKKRLRQKCIGIIDQRIVATMAAIENAQAAANAEEKSSAGDKYETSRAMNHLEKEMHSRQLAANRTELAALYGVNCSSLYNSVTTGSFIQCADCCFFIAAGLGKIHFEGMDIFLISPNAPISKALFKKIRGDFFVFDKKEMTIVDIF